MGGSEFSLQLPHRFRPPFSPSGSPAILLWIIARRFLFWGPMCLFSMGGLSPFARLLSDGFFSGTLYVAFYRPFFPSPPAVVPTRLSSPSPTGRFSLNLVSARSSAVASTPPPLTIFSPTLLQDVFPRIALTPWVSARLGRFLKVFFFDCGLYCYFCPAHRRSFFFF